MAVKPSSTITNPASAYNPTNLDSPLPVATGVTQTNSCHGFFPDFQEQLFQTKMVLYIANAAIDVMMLYTGGMSGRLSQLFMQTCTKSSGRFCKHRCPLPDMFQCGI